MDKRGPVSSDSDLFIHWAAEEFVAAGRAGSRVGRTQHRRRAEFLADVCLALKAEPKRRRSRRRGDHAIGDALDRAFGPID
jgi:hypothetical protein